MVLGLFNTLSIVTLSVVTQALPARILVKLCLNGLVGWLAWRQSICHFAAQIGLELTVSPGWPQTYAELPTSDA